MRRSGFLSRRALGSVICGIVLALAMPVGSAAAATADQLAAGQQVFQSICSGCHSIGQGVKVGPDLNGVTKVQSHDWLVKWITNPSAVVAAGDKTATALKAKFGIQMPTLGLSSDQIEGVIAYIDQQSSGAPAAAGGGAAAAPAEAPLPPGDATMGRFYFTGVDHFQNGGPPCMSCHTVAGISGLGGGAVGPDLTHIYSQIGPSLLQFPKTVLPMKAIFGGPHPLTPQEQADIVAFLKEAPSLTRPANALVDLGATGLGTFVVVLGLFMVIWRKRISGVRAPMVNG